MLLFAIVLPVLLGFVGLAVDVSYLYLQKSRLQNIADTVALATAPQDDSKYKEVIGEYSRNNGLRVEAITGLDNISSPSDENEATIAYGKYAKDKEALQVVITKKVPVFFINVITDKYKDGIDIRVSAVAKPVKETQFAMVAKEGLYVNFTNLADSDTSQIDANNWIYGDVYGQYLIRISYADKGNTDRYQRNLLAVNGHIYTNQFATNLATNKVNEHKKVFFPERISRKDEISNIKTGLQAISDITDEVQNKVRQLEANYQASLDTAVSKRTAEIIDVGNSVKILTSVSGDDLVVKGSGTIILRTQKVKYKNIYSEANIVIEGDENIFDGIVYSKKNIVVTYDYDGEGTNHGNYGTIDKESKPVSHTFTGKSTLFAQNILFGYNYDPDMPNLDEPTNFKTAESINPADDWWKVVYKDENLSSEDKIYLSYLKGCVDKKHSSLSSLSLFDNNESNNIVYFGDGGVAGIPSRWPDLSNDSSNSNLAHHYFEKRTGANGAYLIE